MPSKVIFRKGRGAFGAALAVFLGAAFPGRAAAAPAAATGSVSPLARTFTPWDKPPPPPPPAGKELTALGERVFRGACVGCHGEKGDGSGREGRLLPIPPRDFVTAQFICRHTPSGSLPTDEDLFRSIRRGFKSEVGMPSFRFLSDREVWAVISFLKTLSPRWTSDPVPPPLAVPPPPPFTAAAIARGKAIYKQQGCAACHGPGGRGDGPSAPTLRYDNEKPVRAADFGRPHDFKCGQRPSDIFRTLVNGMDGTPMPSFAEGMSDEQRWDLVQFVLSIGKAAEASATAPGR